MRLKSTRPTVVSISRSSTTGVRLLVVIVPGLGAQVDPRMDFHLIKAVCQFHFIHIGKNAPITLVGQGICSWSGNTHPAPYLWMG